LIGAYTRHHSVRRPEARCSRARSDGARVLLQVWRSSGPRTPCTAVRPTRGRPNSSSLSPDGPATLACQQLRASRDSFGLSPALRFTRDPGVAQSLDRLVPAALPGVRARSGVHRARDERAPGCRASDPLPRAHAHAHAQPSALLPLRALHVPVCARHLDSHARRSGHYGTATVAGNCSLSRTQLP